MAEVMSGMDRQRCLETMRRMRDSRFVFLLLPPSWGLALVRAVEIMEAEGAQLTRIDGAVKQMEHMGMLR